VTRQGRRRNRRGQQIEPDGGSDRSGIFSSTEVELPIGDASEAHQKWGWKPKASSAELVSEMVASDLAVAKWVAANGKNCV
jgi:GDPmannose 4,6-dehydratase